MYSKCWSQKLISLFLWSSNRRDRAQEPQDCDIGLDKHVRAMVSDLRDTKLHAKESCGDITSSRCCVPHRLFNSIVHMTHCFPARLILELMMISNLGQWRWHNLCHTWKSSSNLTILLIVYWNYQTWTSWTTWCWPIKQNQPNQTERKTPVKYAQCRSQQEHS